MNTKIGDGPIAPSLPDRMMTEDPEMMEATPVKNVHAELSEGQRVRIEIGRLPETITTLDLDLADADDLAAAITDAIGDQTHVAVAADSPRPAPTPSRPAPATKVIETQEGIRLLSSADEHRRRLGFSVAEIAEAVFDPQRCITDPSSPARLKCVGGSGVGVVVSFGERIPVVLTVRPASDFSRDFKGSQSWRRGGGGGSTKRVPKSLSPSQLTARLSDMGVSVELSAGHYVVKNGHGQVTFASTPSDHRWLANTISRLRLLLGIDLREDI